MASTQNTFFLDLKRITEKIIDTQMAPHTLRPETLALSELVMALGAYQKQKDIAIDETVTQQGLAVSPTMAAMCVEDYVRTVVFMRGLYAAIQASEKDSEPLQVLYIGCGPYAILAVPLMTLFTPQQVSFTLLDIHEESIQSVKSLAAKLGVLDRIRAFEVMDAQQYQVDPQLPPDIVLMEIMQVCLNTEPQVAICRHIMSQVPEAQLLPQNIRIDLTAMDPSTEFSMQTDAAGNMSYDRKRLPVGRVFALNRETVRQWPESLQQALPAAELVIPEDVPDTFDLLLFTHIRVFAEHVLSEYDSGLTCPQAMPTTQQIQSGSRLLFTYRLGSEPGLQVEILNPT